MLSALSAADRLWAGIAIEHELLPVSYLILVSVSFWCSFSFAAELASPEDFRSLRHDIIFTAPEEGLKEMKLPEALALAAPKIEILDNSGARVTDRCSASVVSDHGHVLTAGHCLENCLRPQRVFDGDAPVSAASLIGITCNVRINGQVFKLPVVATSGCPGQGRFGPRCSGYDYAVLDASALKDQLGACIPVSSSNGRPTDKALALSYPEANERTFAKGEKQNLAAHEKLASIGQIIETKETCLKDGVETRFTPNFPYTTLKRWIHDQTYLQTDIDILRGSSGAGLVNTSGELVGIASLYNIGVHNKAQECKGSTFFTSAAASAREIKTSLPSEVASKVFDCKKNNFIKRARTTGRDI